LYYSVLREKNTVLRVPAFKLCVVNLCILCARLYNLVMSYESVNFGVPVDEIAINESKERVAEDARRKNTSTRSVTKEYISSLVRQHQEESPQVYTSTKLGAIGTLNLGTRPLSVENLSPTTENIRSVEHFLAERGAIQNKNVRIIPLEGIDTLVAEDPGDRSAPDFEPFGRKELLRKLYGENSTEKYNVVRVIERSDMEELWKQVEEFAKEPKIKKMLNGNSLTNLTPYQAAQLVYRLIDAKIAYDYEAVPEYFKALSKEDQERLNSIKEKDPEEYNTYIRERNVDLDSMTAEELLKHGRGVCRHKAGAASAVYEAIKEKQEGPNLNGTYMIYYGTRTNFSASIHAVENHAYNLLVISRENADESAPDADGYLDVVVLDPTMENSIIRYDTTSERVSAALAFIKRRGNLFLKSGVTGAYMAAKELTAAYLEKHEEVPLDPVVFSDYFAAFASKREFDSKSEALVAVFNKVPKEDRIKFFNTCYEADPTSSSILLVGSNRRIMKQPMAEALYVLMMQEDFSGESGPAAGARTHIYEQLYNHPESGNFANLAMKTYFDTKGTPGELVSEALTSAFGFEENETKKDSESKVDMGLADRFCKHCRSVFESNPKLDITGDFVQTYTEIVRRSFEDKSIPESAEWVVTSEKAIQWMYNRVIGRELAVFNSLHSEINTIYTKDDEVCISPILARSVYKGIENKDFYVRDIKTEVAAEFIKYDLALFDTESTGIYKSSENGDTVSQGAFKVLEVAMKMYTQRGEKPGEREKKLIDTALNFLREKNLVSLIDGKVLLNYLQIVNEE